MKNANTYTEQQLFKKVNKSWCCTCMHMVPSVFSLNLSKLTSYTLHRINTLNFILA